MRQQKERGGVENMEVLARLPNDLKDRQKFDPSRSNAIQAIRLEEGKGRSTWFTFNLLDDYLEIAKNKTIVSAPPFTKTIW